ncbi:MAG: ribosome rescue protein RqcH [Candidatus Helarchaeota archaeon]
MFKAVLSNFSIYAMVSEVSSKIKDGWIQQIYQLDEQIFLFRIRTRKSGTVTLLVQPGIRIHLTNYEREKPKVPSKFCMNILRKNLKNLRILNFYQHNFDRICVLELGKIFFDEDKEKREMLFKIVFEFFKYGTLTILNEKNLVVASLHYKQMRDRRVIPNRPYDFAPSRGFNFLQITKEELQDLFKDNEKELIHILLSNLNIGPIYTEEIYLRSGITDFSRTGSSLSKEQIDKIYQTIQEIQKILLEKKFTPQVIKKEGKNYDVTPMSLVRYDKPEYEKISDYENVNEAIDEFYSSQEKTIDHKQIQQAQSQKETKFLKIQKILNEQKKKIEEMKISIEKYRKYGDLIYQNFQMIDELLRTINEARQNNVEWDEIIRKIELGKQKGVAAAQIVKKIIPNNALLQLQLEDETISVDFRFSASEIAEKFYKKSKKARSKLKGAEKALNDTLKKFEKAKTEMEDVQKLKAEKIQKKRKKKWYEGFHWIISSDGFLIVGGRDAKTNEVLMKKYKEKNDIFVHAVFHGASTVLIKTNGKTVPERTLFEAAGITVSYSSAWKSRFSSADAYWVKPEQVSFSPPSGEYLEKGSFIVKGKKEMLKGIPLEIKIGLMIEDDYAIPVLGIGDSLLNKAKYIVSLKPGDLKTAEVSKKIKNHWIERIQKENDETSLNLIKRLKIEEIQRLIPSGKAQLFLSLKS